jgi:hypothetical protein
LYTVLSLLDLRLQQRPGLVDQYSLICLYFSYLLYLVDTLIDRVS